VHEDIYDNLLGRLRSAYASVSVGDPREKDTLVGPLIDKRGYELMQEALDEARRIGAIISGGERLLMDRFRDAYYVRPALVEIAGQGPITQRETFAPILYVIKYRTFDEALQLQNGVSQGLASSIFTNDIGEAERFLSVEGSDCGIANVNIGRLGLRSAAPLAARRIAAADAKRDPIPGRPTCAAPPTPSTIPKTCRSRRE
jgi:aldehyde dehydrogenase (NAD+)